MDSLKKANIVYRAMYQPLKLDFNRPKSATIAGRELQMSVHQMLKLGGRK